MSVNIRYKDLLSKVPEDVEVILKRGATGVIINVRKHIVKRGVSALPSMF